jgi:signal transduction histidine kinase
MSPEIRPNRNTRPTLFAGFGGLLILMALAGLENIRILRSIQTRSDAVRNEFVGRNRILNQIRSDLYLSGTFVRDYVLEPDPVKAAKDLQSLVKTRSALTDQMAEYRRSSGRAEPAQLAKLRLQLRDYWVSVDRVTTGDEAARRAAGYAFLRDEVYPRRTEMVMLADQISATNEHELNERILQVTDLFAGLRLRVAVTMLLVLGLGWMLAAFTTRRILASETAAARHLAEREQARSELKDLSSRLVQAQESERRAISRELHDEVGQSLSALLIGLSNLTAAVPEISQAAIRAPLATVRSLAETSLRSVRDMALLLRPSMLDDLGLVPALQWQGREVWKRSGLVITVDAQGVPDELPDEYRTSVYRVVQEALHNSEQHAAASMVRVTLRGHGSALVLSVQDDGRGFDVEAVRGMGLVGMQERIVNLGGTVSVDSEAGRGTLITVRLPIPT